MSTYSPIATQILGSAVATVTFTNIPQNYNDLIIVSSMAGTGVDSTSLRFNGDTGNNYSYTRIVSNGTTITTSREANISVIKTGTTSAPNITSADTIITNINNYSNNTTYKNSLSRSAATAWVGSFIGTWRNTAPITSITLLIETGSPNLAAGSTFSLYGITAGSTKATGGSVTTDGTYFYHTFYSSNVFTPTQDLTVDYLVIAGGGAGGGNTYGRGTGGGGAGGFRTSIGGTALSLTAQNYPVIVGAGGPATGNDPYGSSPPSYVWGPGGSGSNSSFSTISSTGGGGGGNGSGTPALGLAGGSGGGNAEFSNSAGGAGNAGSYSPVEGYAGGTTTTDYGSTGGGGAGGAGVNRTTNSGTNGGIGRQLTALATPTGTGVSSGYYAGGGGGGADFDSGNRGAGTGGTGGGGNGATDSANAGGGVTNTGSGGGGGSGNGGAGRSGAAGGSGIVIVRYAV
jgi:hypothetical protein